EADDHAEIAAASAQSPEQWAVGHRSKAPVGGHDVEAADVVGGEPVAAGHEPEAAAERVADRAHARGAAGQRGEAVWRGRLDHPLPGGPGLDIGGAGG